MSFSSVVIVSLCMLASSYNPGLVMWDFVMDESGSGAGFLRELRFVSPANLHSISFSTIIFTITRGWHNGPGVAAVPIASQTRIKKKSSYKQAEDGSSGSMLGLGFFFYLFILILLFGLA
jgi:hypothetical protein